MDVLIIEPDALLSSIYAQALRQLGLKVEEASDAQEAINIIDMKLPRLIVLDIQLGRHNGIEFIHELRSYVDWQDVPLIVQSMIPVHELYITDESQKQLGIKKVLYKPKAKIDDFTKICEEILKE